MKRNEKMNLNHADILVFLILLLEDAGMFGILPIGIAQLLTLILGVVLSVQIIYARRAIPFSYKLPFLFLYMSFITVFFPFDEDSVTNFFLFVIEMTIFYLYISTIGKKEKLLWILYNVGFVLAIIGIIQEIGYLLNIKQLCDMTLYGFPRECVYPFIGSRLARVSSLYSEPASLIGIMAAAFMIILCETGKTYVKWYKNATLFVFVVLTQSTLLYFAYALIFAIYVLFVKQERYIKGRWILLMCMSIAGITILKSDLILRVMQKLLTLNNPSAMNTTDLSAFALVSNLKIAIEKLKDGYLLGTGFNTHRLYYEHYIAILYKEVLMKLSYADAGSMYTRSLSEFGLPGFFYLFFGIARNFFAAYAKEDNFRLLCVTVLAITFLRDGNYIRTLPIMLFLIVFIQKDLWGRTDHELYKVYNRICGQ